MKFSIKLWFRVATFLGMVDPKLSGEYDYAGQFQGKSVAIRKK